MNPQRVSQLTVGAMALACAGIALPVHAQTVTPFQMVGHIQQFVLDPTIGIGCPAPNVGARMTVNGIEVTIPCYSVILFPAAYKTPRQIFDEAKGISKAQNQSGLALQDTTGPLAAFEVALDGNIVCNSGPTCRYIAGQVHISQQSLNSGAGFIKDINVNTGEMRVGAHPYAPVTEADVRLHINDPEVSAGGSGRYGLSNTQQFPAVLPDTILHSRYPDDRFQVDQDNPTIHALTGYPMCLPRPLPGGDPACPMTNRSNAPKGVDGKPLKTYVMAGGDLPGTPGIPEIKACQPVCDGTKQAPMMVGDYITYQGTMASYPDPTDPAKNVLYVSAHTIEVNIGIYTEQGKDPAYVSVEPILIGTKGDAAICEGGSAECQDRIKVEGFTTDPSRSVNIYAVDITPTGAGGFTTSLRLIAPGATKPAPFGRFRFTADKNAGVLVDRTGMLRGATRELVARIESSAGILPGQSKPFNNLPLFANGLQAGQYQAPIGEYIYPEPHDMGGSLPPLNFQCLSFLARGWELDGLILKRLDPWPGFNDAPLDERFFSCTK